MASNVNIAITGDAKGFEAAMTSASNSAKQFGSSLESSGNKSQSLKGALRSAKTEAMNLQYQLSQLSETELGSDIGQQLQAQLQTAIQAAGELQDQFADVNQEIKNMASDTMAWDAASQGIGVVSSGLQGLASVYGLLGGDVKAFAQALVAVNAIQSVSNTITAIGNALQKQSALMVGLRAAKNAILGTSIGTVAAAETAATAATTANTAATTAATTAQWSLNAAVLANPYVLIAAAIIAAVGALVWWISTAGEATDAEIAAAAAVDAFSEAVDSEMKKVAEQIQLYNQLKDEYDSCGGKIDEFAKKLINNTDLQKKLGVTVKTTADVHRLFANQAGKYAEACILRGSAMAAEAAQAAMLGETLAQLSQVQAKLAAGQEVNWRDMRNIVEAAGYSSDAADRLMKAAGYVYEGEGMAYGNIQKGTGDMAKLVQLMQNGGAFQALQDMGKSFREGFKEIDEVDFGGMLTDNFSAWGDAAEKSGKKASSAAKSASKNTANAVKEVLTSLKGCDAIIQQAEKNMKELDSTSKTYAADMQKLKDVVLTARIAKLQLLDKSTVSGLMESRKLIEQIMQSLPQGSEILGKMREELKKCDENLFNMLKSISQSGGLGDLKAVRSQIDKIIETLPEGSEEIEKWAAAWREVNSAIVGAEGHLSEIKAGPEGSPARLKAEKSRLQKQLDQTSDLSIRTQLELQIDEIDKQLTTIENKWKYEFSKTIKIEDVAVPEVDVEGNLTGFHVEKQAFANLDIFSYRNSDIENQKEMLDQLNERVKWLKEQLESPTTPDWGLEKVKDELAVLEPELENWKEWVTSNEIGEDIKNFTKELGSAWYDEIKKGSDALKGLYDNIVNLPDKLDECKDGFEGFFIIMEALFSTVDSVIAFIEGIQKITEIIKGLTAAKEALNIVEGESAGIKLAESAATQTQVVSEGEKTAADSTSAGVSAAKTAALKTEEAALLDAAAAQIFAAHSYIPFAGVGIAAGMVAAMMGAMAAQHAASMALAAFAEGGIVKGSTTMGDSIIARLNAGEMVLNGRQQARLFRMIDSGVIGTNNNELSGTIRVSGSDLYVALNNYNKITGKKL